MSRLEDLLKLEQSIWYDNIRRALIDSGELQDLIEVGVRGVTSNPSIFAKAIEGSADYDEAIAELNQKKMDPEEIFEALAIEDIQRTADLLYPVYEKSDRLDGYVSLEVNPTLAHDPEGTITEAGRLYDRLERSNVMIKVPATEAGIPAIERLTAMGINVNVTLIFSLATYEAVAEAYLRGLETLIDEGGDPRRVASVASFFVSRVDTAIDEELAKRGISELQGKIAIANAKAAYARFGEIFGGSRWKRLAEAGARPQRPLWASTGTKNPAYPDTLYVDELIGPQTVNTVPPATLSFFLDHGTVRPALTEGIKEAKGSLDRLAELGIDLSAVTDRLQTDGVAAFAKAYQSLLESVSQKQEALRTGRLRMETRMGPYQGVVDQGLTELRDGDVLRRIWEHDHTVWRPEPNEISNRLGWLHAPENMQEQLDRIRGFVAGVQADGFRHALLLGMGGSSLAPEVFSNIYGGSTRSSNGYLELGIVDSTDSDLIATRLRGVDLAKTLLIVATKSGGTVETLSGFKYFYNRVLEAVGHDSAGRHFIAITDPGSQLEGLAAEYGFRDVFLNDPNIGGRYSALSYFGLVPAALVGVDVERLLDRALTVACNAASANCPMAGDNDGGRLGVILGELARNGRDKLTVSTSPGIASFGDWVEQLIAESTGKDGKGILPVVGEPLGPPSAYSSDRVFVDLRLAGDQSREAKLAALAKAGHPVITIELKDEYDLGGQFFLWEMATAVAGSRLGIHPFDQPNVEAAKVLAREMVAEYSKTGQLPEGEASTLTREALQSFLNQVREGDYVAIQAYALPSPETDRALRELRLRIRDRLRVATTTGYGPRFLHSTGQLHKGDGGNGLFIQLTSDPAQDIPIPEKAGEGGSKMTFQVLKTAQALGDAQALMNVDRRLIRFDLGGDVTGGIEKLQEWVP